MYICIVLNMSLKNLYQQMVHIFCHKLQQTGTSWLYRSSGPNYPLETTTISLLWLLVYSANLRHLIFPSVD